MIFDAYETPDTKEDVIAAKQAASQLLGQWKKRALYASIGFVLSWVRVATEQKTTQGAHPTELIPPNSASTEAVGVFAGSVCPILRSQVPFQKPALAPGLLDVDF